jgi:hypothetical protein
MKGYPGERQQEHSNLVYVGDAHAVNLCKKLPYVLIRGFSIITVNLARSDTQKPHG